MGGPVDTDASKTNCGELCVIIYKGDEGPCYCEKLTGHEGDHVAVYSSRVADSVRKWRICQWCGFSTIPGRCTHCGR